MSAEATTGSRSTHWIANCASVCPRSLAMTSSPRRVASALSVRRRPPSDQRCCERSALPSPRYLFVSSPWASGVNAIAPSPSFSRTPRETVLDPAVEDRVRGLVDHERRAEAPRDGRRHDGLLGAVRRDADVQRLALAHERVEGADRLLDGHVRVVAVRVEDVDVVDAHARERLLGAREQVLARASVRVRSVPHVVAGLRRDDQLVAVRREVLAHHPAEVRLGRAVRRAVVVGQVEVRDALVERVAEHLALAVEGDVVAEVPPQSERDGRKGQARRADLAVVEGFVAVVSRGIGPVEVSATGAVARWIGHRSRLACRDAAPPARAGKAAPHPPDDLSRGAPEKRGRNNVRVGLPGHPRSLARSGGPMPALSVLPVETHTWSALLTRTDVTLDRGILHLRHDSVTAAGAETEDLLLVASTLEARRHRHDTHPPRGSRAGDRGRPGRSRRRVRGPALPRTPRAAVPQAAPRHGHPRRRSG